MIDVGEYKYLCAKINLPLPDEISYTKFALSHCPPLISLIFARKDVITKNKCLGRDEWRC